MTDARRFILRNRQIIEETPLQVYTSAVNFTPRNSLVRRKYIVQLPTWFCYFPLTDEDWSLELQVLEGHAGVVEAVAFSPDGQLLASGSRDHTIRLWDVKTGVAYRVLECPKALVTAVTFSPNCRTLASGFNDGSIRLWNVKTGGSLGAFIQPERCAMAMAFHPTADFWSRDMSTKRS
jgi:WD40 repeat protein